MPRFAGREIFDSRGRVVIVGARHRLALLDDGVTVLEQPELLVLADPPCVAAGRTLKECMEVEDGGCKGLRVAYFTCKRGQLDMRKRIKGNLPQHVDDTEEDNFGGRLLEIQRRKREEDEARKAHAARS